MPSSGVLNSYMGVDKSMTVHVVYALSERQTSAMVQLGCGSTVLDAVRRSGILAIHPEIDIVNARLGVFGHIADRDQVVHDGDRIEIYRPLKIDPKERRRTHR